MSEQSEKNLEWKIISIDERVDSFNQVKVMDKIQKLVKEGQFLIALNMTETQFISFTVIKFLSEIASELKQNDGLLALFSTSEKLKRQISIYASLNDLGFCRSEDDLDRLLIKPSFSNPETETRQSSGLA